MENKVRKDLPIPASKKPGHPGGLAREKKWYFEELKEYGDSFFVANKTEKQARATFAAWRHRRKGYYLWVLTFEAAIDIDSKGAKVSGVRMWRNHDRDLETANRNSVSLRMQGKKKPKRAHINDDSIGSNKLSATDVKNHINNIVKKT